MVKENRSHLRVVILLLVCFVLYGITSNRIVCTNDKSHYALVQAIAEKGSLRIDDTRGELIFDFSSRNGHYYSDRPPGTAFLAVPFYLAGKPILHVMPSLHRWLHAGFFVTLLPVLLGTIGVLFIYLLAQRLGCSEGVGFILAILYAFATINWKYSSVLFSHVPVATFGLVLAYFLFGFRTARTVSPVGILALGICYGLLPLFEYPAILMAVAAGAYLFFVRRKPEKRRDWKGRFRLLIIFGGGVLIGVIPLLAYSWHCFGSPFATSYRYQATFEWAQSFRQTFSGNFKDGFLHLLFGWKKGGLLVTAPFFLLSLFGARPSVLKERGRLAEGIYLVGLFVGFLLLMSLHRTYWGGGTNDTRYLLIVTGYFLLPAGFVLDSILAHKGKKPYTIWAFAGRQVLIFGGLIGVAFQIYRIMNFFGHDYILKLELHNPVYQGRGGRVLLYLHALLPSAYNFIFYLVIGCAIIAIVEIVRFRVAANKI